MPAIMKTGGWTFLAEYGRFVYGDIYKTKDGTIFVRVIADISSNYTCKKPEDRKIWATIDHVEGDFTDGRMQTLIGSGKMHWRWAGDAEPIQMPTDTPVNP